MSTQTQNKPALKVPRVYKRRPYEDDKPGGYLEGFTDYASNNQPAVEWFLENHRQIKEVINSHVELVNHLRGLVHMTANMIDVLKAARVPVDSATETRLELARSLLSKLS